MPNLGPPRQDSSFYLSTKIDGQCERCELTFIWCIMRTAAQETAPQIALETASKRQWGKVNI